MGHNITAIIVKGDFDESTAIEYDLLPVKLKGDLTLFHIDHYYSAYWQYILKTTGNLERYGTGDMLFPGEIVIAEIVKRIARTDHAQYGIIVTNWFGGVGGSCANVYTGTRNADRSITTVNDALKHLGIVATKAEDEWDIAGLGAIRGQPEYLEKYITLAEGYGV